MAFSRSISDLGKTKPESFVCLELQNYQSRIVEKWVAEHCFTNFPQFCRLSEPSKAKVRSKSVGSEWMISLAHQASTKELVCEIHQLTTGNDASLNLNLWFQDIDKRKIASKELKDCRLSHENGRKVQACLPMENFQELKQNFLNVIIIVAVYHKERPGEEPLARAKMLPEDLSSMLATGHHADVSVHFGRNQILAHRFVLAARSRALENALCTRNWAKENDNDENEKEKLVVNDFSYDVVLAFLQYLYSDKIPQFTPSSAMELLKISDKFCMPSLKQACCEYLTGHIDCGNACSILIAAELYGNPHMRRKVIEYICINKETFDFEDNKVILMKHPCLLFEVTKRLAAGVAPDN